MLVVDAAHLPEIGEEDLIGSESKFYSLHNCETTMGAELTVRQRVAV